MSIIKKITILLGIFFISGVAQLSAQEVKKIGKYKDWEALVVMDADGKVCFAQSLPILQAPKTNKRDAKLFVAFRPNDNIKNEVSVTPGVTLTSFFILSFGLNATNNFASLLFVFGA